MNEAGRQEQAVTIRDVAAHAGVSAGTVSNVLNRPFYVNADTRERVIDAIRELDFVPRQAARQFRPGRLRTIGMAAANLANPFFVDVVLGADTAAAELDLGMVVTNSAYDADRENQNLDMLVQQRVQGIIISPVDESSSSLQMLRDRGVPTVFVDRVGDQKAGAWSALVDDRMGGRIGAQHLIDRGYRRIAFVGHPEQSPKVRMRVEGAREAVEWAGNVHLDVVTAASWTVEAGRAAGDLIADRRIDRRPEAVLCANDMVALGAIQAFTAAGLRVPEDIAVVGYDDIEWAEVSSPRLTTIRQPRQLLGATAVRMIMELFAQDRPRPRDNHVMLQPELVVRDSA
ncbi:MAG: LacI family DNA-binding transcriptional regulator [Microbacterium gubbeenense]